MKWFGCFFLNITWGCHQGNLSERQSYFSQPRQQPLGAPIAMGTTSSTLKVTAIVAQLMPDSALAPVRLKRVNIQSQWLNADTAWPECCPDILCFSPHETVKLLPATTLVLLWGAALHTSGEQDRGRWGQGVEAHGGHTQSHGNCLLIQPGQSLRWGFETRHGDSTDSSQRAGSAAGTGEQQKEVC